MQTRHCDRRCSRRQTVPGVRREAEAEAGRDRREGEVGAEPQTPRPRDPEVDRDVAAQGGRGPHLNGGFQGG